MKLYEKHNTENGKRYLGKLLWGDFGDWVLKKLKELKCGLVAFIEKETDKLWAAQRGWSVFISDTMINYGINTWTVVPYSQIHFQGCRYDTKDYRYYAQKTGSHNITALLKMSPSIATPLSGLVDLEIAVFKNGAFYKPLDFEHGSATSAYKFCLNGSCEVFMHCGEYIDIRFRHQCSDTIRDTNTINPKGYFDGHYSADNSKIVNPTVQSA
jgi:hypothetical protein